MSSAAFLLVSAVLVVAALDVSLPGQPSSGSGLTSDHRSRIAAQPLGNPPADAGYRPTALRLLLEEANQVARELKLPERLPITESNLLEVYIPARLVPRRTILAGTVTTSNYIYCVDRGGKFWSLVRRDFERDRARRIAQYLWPIGRLDTNAAYQAAAAILAAISVDVQGLNRDCRLRVSAMMPEGNGGQRFVPSYAVSWYKSGEEEAVAGIDIFEPTKLLDQLYVNKPEYIHRRVLWVEGPDNQAGETNSARPAPNPFGR